MEAIPSSNSNESVCNETAISSSDDIAIPEGIGSDMQLVR